MKEPVLPRHFEHAALGREVAAQESDRAREAALTCFRGGHDDIGRIDAVEGAGHDALEERVVERPAAPGRAG